MTHDLNHRLMLNSIKRLREVKFQNTAGSPGCLALVDVFKGLGQAVLDRSPFKESIRIPMDGLKHDFLQAISKLFSYEF